MNTRQKQTVIAIVLLGVAQAVAQAQGITLKAGLSYGVSSNNGLAPGTTQRSGFAIGVGMATSGPIGLGVEALYAQRGYTSTTPGDSRRLDYIDVPVYLRLALPTGEVRPFGYVGPQGSYELNCGGDGITCPATGRDKITYSGIIGGGVKFAALNNLSVEARYVYGLSDLKLSTVGAASSYKSRSLLLLAGIGF